MTKRVMFIGSKQLGIKALKCLYELSPDSLTSAVTIDDADDTRSELHRFREFSSKTNNALYILKKPSDLRKVIQKEKPDICIVVCWYWIIKPNILKKVPAGFIGIHASLLPKYRGGAPLVWPIINCEKESGLSLFYFDEGMDTGDIIGQKKFSITEEDCIGTITAKAEELILELLIDFYPSILADKAPRKKQNHQIATYCSQRKPEDGRINWRASNYEIHNFVRAQSQPYPGAFCYHKGVKIYIWKIGLFPYPYSGIPGLVVQSIDDKVIVTCGKDAVYIHEVQFEGSKLETASKILKYGIRLE